MKPTTTRAPYRYDMGTFEMALIIRALECYAEHTENDDASDAVYEARYLKSLGEYDEETGVMRGFYTEE